LRILYITRHHSFLSFFIVGNRLLALLPRDPSAYFGSGAPNRWTDWIQTWENRSNPKVKSYLFVLVQHLLLLASVHLVVHLLCLRNPCNSVCFCSARWIVAGLLLRISSLSDEQCWRVLSLVWMHQGRYQTGNKQSQRYRFFWNAKISKKSQKRKDAQEAGAPRSTFLALPLHIVLRPGFVVSSPALKDHGLTAKVSSAQGNYFWDWGKI